jgi:hypothetical protein
MSDEQALAEKVLLYLGDSPEHAIMTFVEDGSTFQELIGLARKVQDSRQERFAISGVELIKNERERQVNEEGYTPEHDDEHDLGELGLAAALYALPYDAKQGDDPLLKQDDFIGLHIALEVGCDFVVKPETDPLRRLVKSGSVDRG